VDGRRTPKERLYWLIHMYKSKKIDIDTFCNEFHITYSHYLDKKEINEKERILFSKLAYDSARFSEFEEDHVKYPTVYSTEKDIDEQVNSIIRKLNLEITE
jgi:hypothetical protein